ncbi:MAG: J domain-containing protein [Candidatus Limnocylindrales bacterium]
MAQTFDPYRALGLRRDATDADVKTAHRKLAKRFHPDAENGDKDRVLRVQEAYKVLTNPLLRREWDARHAPGPMRADRPSPAAPGAGPRPRAPRRPPRPPQQDAPPRAADGEAGGSPGTKAPDSAARRPRSSRAYTWSAAEVPWWEEGTSESRRQPGRKRPARAPAANPGGTQPGTQPGTQAGAPPDAEPAPGGPNPFDVHNRSSGAAWSMAARAYFRRGDQELPRRGTFQYEGTQVLTGARARTHAEAEARRHAAEANREPRGAAAVASAPGSFTYTASGVSRDAHRIHQVRQAWRRRTNAASWPTLRERLLYALLAWIPVALVIGYGGALVTGCALVGIDCPPYLETSQAIAIAIALGVLVALPKVAYVGALAAIGALFVGLAVVALMAVSSVELPLSMELTALLGGALAAGYAATAAVVLIRRPASRPWFTGARP